jgi:hypothetical protein
LELYIANFNRGEKILFWCLFLLVRSAFSSRA